MDSAELVEAFEAGTIAPAAFSHETHVRAAWGLAQKYGETDGLERMIAGSSRIFTPCSFRSPPLRLILPTYPANFSPGV